MPAQFFELVGEALVRRRRVRMTYLTRGRNEVSERDISPQRLVHYRNTWYVDAWCHSRERLLRSEPRVGRDAADRVARRDDEARDQARRQRGFAAFVGHGRMVLEA